MKNKKCYKNHVHIGIELKSDKCDTKIFQFNKSP